MAGLVDTGAIVIYMSERRVKDLRTWGETTLLQLKHWRTSARIRESLTPQEVYKFSWRV